MSWRIDLLGRWHWLLDGAAACGTAIGLARATSVDPPRGDRCPNCAAFAPAPPERQRKRRQSGPKQRATAARPTIDSTHTTVQAPTITIDFSEPYFASLRNVIRDSPARYVFTTVLFCGEWPYSVAALSLLLPAQCLWYDQLSVPTQVVAETVVIGQVGASRTVMEEQLSRSRGLGASPPRFLPQEAFIDEVIFGHDWWNDYPYLLNGALAYHSGLQAAHELHVGEVPFDWPSTEAEESPALEEPDGTGFAPETPLHALGYRITGLARQTRWTVLTTSAIPTLGLQTVAETIAMNVRLRKAQHGGRSYYRRAIAEWEHDLDRLKTEYWMRLAYRFPWPGTEP